MAKLNDSLGIFKKVSPEEEFRKTYSGKPQDYEPRLKGASDKIRPFIFQLINEGQKKGYDYRLRDTLRTPEEQAKKVKGGFSKTYNSFHLDQIPKYTIKSGDTLSQVATKHGVTMQDLARINKIRDPNKIQVGQQIKVLPKGEGSYAFDLVLYRDGKYVEDATKEDFQPIRDIIKKLNIPVQQGIITEKTKGKGDWDWWDWGHIQLPSKKGMYGGVKNWKDLVFPENKKLTMTDSLGILKNAS